MINEKAIIKRQSFVVSQLHELSQILNLNDRDEALARALEMQDEMAYNIAPFIVWQRAVNNAVKELQE